METLTLSTRAMDELGRTLRERSLIEFPQLFWEVLGQKPSLLFSEEDSNRQQEKQICLF